MRPLPALIALSLFLCGSAAVGQVPLSNPGQRQAGPDLFFTPPPAQVVNKLFEQSKPADGPAPPPTSEETDFATARDLLEQGGTATAAGAFEEFLQKYPRSTKGAEALYRLQMAYWLKGDTGKAIETRKSLLERHPDSPWSQLVLRVDLGEEELREYARQLRDVAQRTRGHADAGRAAQVLRLYYDRFPRTKGVMNPVETYYLAGACEEIGGSEQVAREMYRMIAPAVQADSAWKKLAALRLGDAAAFAAELRTLRFGEREFAYLLLDLLAKHESQLSNADLACGQARRGEALLELKRKEEGRAALARFVDEHPGTDEAPAALFRLAESLYAEDKRDEAADRFRQFAQWYPAETHARRAKHWAAWMEDEKQDWAELKAALASLARQMRAAKGTFAVTVEGGPVGKAESGRLRMAFDGNKRFLLDVKVGEVGVQAVSTPRGGCVVNRHDRQATRSRQPLDVPFPGLVMAKDPATGRYNQMRFWCGEDAVPVVPALDVPDEAAEHLVEQWLRKEFHLRRRERDGGVIYRLESAAVSPEALQVVELELDGEGKFRGLRVSSRQGEERLKWAVTELRLGALPDELFAVKVPGDVKVRRVEKLSQLAWWVQIWGMFDRLGEEAGPAGQALLSVARGVLGR